MRLGRNGLLIAGMVCAWLVAGGSRAAAQGCGAEVVGSVRGTINEIVVRGDLAYLAAGESGVEVFDLRAPSTPELLGRIDLPKRVDDLDVVGDLAFAAASTAGLVVLDVGDPSEPTVAGQLRNPVDPEVVEAVAARGSFAYVSLRRLNQSEMFFAVVDVSEPSLPRTRGAVPLAGRVRGIALSGDVAFVSQGLGGTMIVDIADPDRPGVLGMLDAPGFTGEVAVVGSALVVQEVDGLVFFDVSDPANPVALSRVMTEGIATDFSVDGGRVYLYDRDGSSDGGLKTTRLVEIDVSDPADPRVVNAAEVPAIFGSYTVGNGLAHVFRWRWQVFDLADASAPVLAADLDRIESAFGVGIRGDYAFVASLNQSLVVVDVAEPSEPRIETVFDAGFGASHIAIDGDRAYVVSSFDDLAVVDISDPATPVVLGRIEFPFPAVSEAIAVSGDIVLVADSFVGVRLIDVSDPANPSTVAVFDTQDEAEDVAVKGDLAFVAAERSGLLVVDIGDPADPELVGDLQFDGAFGSRTRAVKVRGDLAFVGDNGAGFVVVDIGDPTDPVELGSLPAEFVNDIAVRGARAVVATSNDGYLIVDISDPAGPELLGAVPTSSLGERVVISGDIALLADRYAGLQVVDLSSCDCEADLTGSSEPGGVLFGEPDGDADAEDFFFFLDALVAGDLGVCDLTGPADPGDPGFGVADGDCDADDFDFYLGLFVSGCP